MEGPPEEASVHHGKKRHGDDDLAHEQRLVKRFNLLNLGMPVICTLFAAINVMTQRIMANCIFQSSKPRRSMRTMMVGQCN